MIYVILFYLCKARGIKSHLNATMKTFESVYVVSRLKHRLQLHDTCETEEEYNHGQYHEEQKLQDFKLDDENLQIKFTVKYQVTYEVELIHGELNFIPTSIDNIEIIDMNIEVYGENENVDESILISVAEALTERINVINA